MNDNQLDAYLTARSQGLTVTAAAAEAGCSFIDLGAYRREHPELAELEAMAQAQADDLVLDALFQAASSGNVQAICAYLSRRTAPLRMAPPMQHEPEDQDAGRRPWHRLNNESTKAFEAFAVYRDLGATRTAARVQTKCNKSASLVTKWSVRHRWIERARQYDDHQDSMQLAARDAAVSEMNLLHAEIAHKALDLVGRRIASMDPNEIKAADVPRWLVSLNKVERQARGLPLDTVAVVGATGGPVHIEHHEPTEDGMARIVAILADAGALPDFAPGPGPLKLVDQPST